MCVHLCVCVCVCVGVGSADGWRALNVCDFAANTSGFLFIDDCFQTGCTHTHTHTQTVALPHIGIHVIRLDRSHCESWLLRHVIYRLPVCSGTHTSSSLQNDYVLETVIRTSNLHSTTVLMSTSWINLSHLTDRLCFFHSYRCFFFFFFAAVCIYSRCK